MSIIKKNLRPVYTPEETLPEFLGHNDDPRFGLEVETHFVDQELNGATPASFYKLQAALDGKAGISLEAASTMFEVKNNVPKSPENGDDSLASAELIDALRVIEDEIIAMDHVIAPHSILPWSNFADLAKTHIHKGENPRPSSFTNFFMQHNPARARNFITVAGQQSSLTHRTPLDNLIYFNRMAHLAPVLTAIMSTVPPYGVLDNGEFAAVRTNLSLSRRLQTGGGAQNAFPALDQVNALNAAEAQDFMTRWNDHVWNTPIFSYYDPDDTDEFTRLRHFTPSGTTIAFRDLPERLKTRENFNMASSIQYGLITMSHIPAGDTTSDRRRVEVRFFDTGTANQIRTVASLSHAVAFHDDFAERTDRFIARAGFDPHHPAQSLPLLTRQMNQAASTILTTLDQLPYGTRSVAEAAKEFGETVLQPMLQDYPDLAALLHQCRKGTSPALEFRTAVHNADDFARRSLHHGHLYRDHDDAPHLGVF